MPVTRVDPADFDAPGSEPAATLRRVVAEATAADGAAPLDEAALLTLSHGLGTSTLWVAGDDGFAWRHGSALDVVVAPRSRSRGLGTALVRAATEETGPLTAWSHGDHPAAAALAGRGSFERVRDLWVMRRSLADLPELPATAGAEAGGDALFVRTFRVGQDEDAWLAVNAAAFAGHPEQGSLTRSDLEERLAQDWFDPDGFFLAWRGEALVGFHWTKVHAACATEAAVGEVYVVGVDPGAQGGGLGKRLTLTGLHHLARQGLDRVLLYVEADNSPAVAVYERLGFDHAPHDTHVQYARATI